MIIFTSIVIPSFSTVELIVSRMAIYRVVIVQSWMMCIATNNRIGILSTWMQHYLPYPIPMHVYNVLSRVRRFLTLTRPHDRGFRMSADKCVCVICHVCIYILVHACMFVYVSMCTCLYMFAYMFACVRMYLQPWTIPYKLSYTYWYMPLVRVCVKVQPYKGDPARRASQHLCARWKVDGHSQSAFSKTLHSRLQYCTIFLLHSIDF